MNCFFFRHLKGQFYAPKPTVHICIDILLKLQTETYLKMNGCTKRRGQKMIDLQKQRKKYRRIFETAYQKRENNADLLQYLKNCSSTTLPVDL